MKSNAKIMPSLSPSGWTSVGVEKLDLALCHFLEADPNMSLYNRDSVCNLQVIIAEHTDSIPDMCSELEKSLLIYLQTLFDYAEVQVTDLEETEGVHSPEVTLNFNIKALDQGKPITIDKLVKYRNSKFILVANYNNYGILPDEYK